VPATAISPRRGTLLHYPGAKMAKYTFSAAQRWAVYSVHGARCYLCSKPIDLKSMQVDHILPESLLDDPARLGETLRCFGLPARFDLNSYENWMPSCPPCNNLKRATVFAPTPIIQVVLGKAKGKADEARRAEAETLRNQELGKALAVVERATSSNEFDFTVLKPLVIAFAQAMPEAARALLAQTRDDVIEMLTTIPRAEFFVAPFFKVLYTNGGIQLVQTPRGVGFTAARPDVHHSFCCGHCGSPGPWNGAQCLSCGLLDDGD
jgi:hypothetical protein